MYMGNMLFILMNGLVGMAFGGASMGVNKAIDASKFM